MALEAEWSRVRASRVSTQVSPGLKDAYLHATATKKERVPGRNDKGLLSIFYFGLGRRVSVPFQFLIHFYYFTIILLLLVNCINLTALSSMCENTVYYPAGVMQTVYLDDNPLGTIVFLSVDSPCQITVLVVFGWCALGASTAEPTHNTSKTTYLPICRR